MAEFMSMPCGRVLGIPIRLHVLLPLAPVLACASTAAAGHPWPSVLLAGLITGPLLLLTVLVHELGHVLAARRCGCQADHILLWPLGGLAFIGGQVKPKEQIFISGSGPATHLPMMGAPGTSLQPTVNCIWWRRPRKVTIVGGHHLYSKAYLLP